jgi:hypothetical protein
MYLVIVFFFLISTSRNTNADFTFGEPVNLKSVIPVIDPLHDGIDCVSSDGLEMYIGSDRPGGHGDYDLWVLRRNSIDDDWELFENLGPTINSASGEWNSSISDDGLTFYFSRRPGIYGKTDIYMTTRATKDAPWGEPVNLGSKINTSSSDAAPWISTDGLELFFSSRRSDGYGDTDIYVTRRATQNEPWGDPENLGPLVNSAYADSDPWLSPDGLALVFSGTFFSLARPGGHGGSDMWMTRRVSRSDPWQTPVNLGSPVNSPAHEIIPCISPDGFTLYFCTNSNGIWDNWQAPISPIVDLNGDGIIDALDMCIIVDNWGTDEPLCDIGPMPWGDGVVDVQDLIVLSEHLFEEVPPVE